MLFPAFERPPPPPPRPPPPPLPPPLASRSGAARNVTAKMRHKIEKNDLIITSLLFLSFDNNRSNIRQHITVYLATCRFPFVAILIDGSINIDRGSPAAIAQRLVHFYKPTVSFFLPCSCSKSSVRVKDPGTDLFLNRIPSNHLTPFKIKLSFYRYGEVLSEEVFNYDPNQNGIQWWNPRPY